MVPWAKHLLRKREDLNSDPSTQKRPGCTSVISALGEVDSGRGVSGMYIHTHSVYDGGHRGAGVITERTTIEGQSSPTVMWVRRFSSSHQACGSEQ